MFTCMASDLDIERLGLRILGLIESNRAIL